MSHSRKSSKASGSSNLNNIGKNHQNHKNLRRHLDMGQPGYMGEGVQNNNQATSNLFEIKKRSIDFFNQVGIVVKNIFQI